MQVKIKKQRWNIKNYSNRDMKEGGHCHSGHPFFPIIITKKIAQNDRDKKIPITKNLSKNKLKPVFET